jgi:tetratricopeptide (TPR) repeat protein
MNRHKIVYMAAVAALCLLTAGRVVLAAGPSEDAAAEELYQRGDYVGALPLYERLAAGNPTSAAYAERLAFSLTASFEILPAGKERDELIERARFEAERSRLLGNKSNLLQILLDRLKDPAIHSPSEELVKLRDAEKAFGRGDYDAALAGYLAVAKENPGSYVAHLYVGDVHFIRGDVAQAGEWFAKAIAIDPTVETAHRYWGDAIAKSGDEKAALPHYIRAVVADPYNRTSWTGLRQWADRTGARLQQLRLPTPQVSLKDGKTGKEAEVQINLDPATVSDQEALKLWLAYAAARGVWLKGRFVEENPGATAYRHSLQEELRAFHLALDVYDVRAANESAAIRTLRQLAAEDMLACYVLLNAADEGIAQDYAAYRDQNRDRLVTYVEKYMILPGAKLK